MFIGISVDNMHAVIWIDIVSKHCFFIKWMIHKLYSCNGRHQSTKYSRGLLVPPLLETVNKTSWKHNIECTWIEFILCSNTIASTTYKIRNKMISWQKGLKRYLLSWSSIYYNHSIKCLFITLLTAICNILLRLSILPFRLSRV